MRSAEFARAGGQTHHHRDVKDAPAPLNAAPEHLEPLVCRQVHVPRGQGQGRYDRMWTVSPTHAENSAGVLSVVAHVVVAQTQSAKKARAQTDSGSENLRGKAACKHPRSCRRVGLARLVVACMH